MQLLFKDEMKDLGATNEILRNKKKIEIEK